MLQVHLVSFLNLFKNDVAIKITIWLMIDHYWILIKLIVILIFTLFLKGLKRDTRTTSIITHGWPPHMDIIIIIIIIPSFLRYPKEKRRCEFGYWCSKSFRWLVVWLEHPQQLFQILLSKITKTFCYFNNSPF